MTDLRALHRLARWHGVITEYNDVSQRRVPASCEALLNVLRALGVGVEHPDEAREALAQAVDLYWRQLLEPVTVAWQGATTYADLRLPENLPLKRMRACIQLETGGSVALPLHRARVVKGARALSGPYVRRRIPLPRHLPPGYHTLEVETADHCVRSRVLCAPVRVWQPATRSRGWGVFLPLYAVHSDSSLGCGDYSDLRRLMEWTAEQGGRMVGTLPLLPLHLPGDPSPYSPLSKLFWNEFYVDVTRAPEWGQCRQPAIQLPARGHTPPSEWVDYPGVLNSKRASLEAMARFFFSKPSERRVQFERWINPEARRYAEFRAVTDARGTGWTRWPERLRAGNLQPGDYDAAARDCHLYAQWLAQEQMAELSTRSRELGVMLYLDLPLGVHAEGFDVWREQELFASQASGGAPPDPVFTKGQDWGFAPLHPRRLREQGYRYLIACLRHHLSRAGALRFDHVMGLHRLFWVPHGRAASEGAYVRYAPDELYAILSLESHRHRSLIVGENLGTVPPAVNRAMSRHGVRQMYVAQYELRSDAKRALRPVPARAVASLNTHDMPPFAAFWRGSDLADRWALGLVKHLDREERCRRRMTRALAGFLRRGRFLGRGADPSAVLRGCLGYLSASRAEWVLINLEDLWLETRSQNTPGTTAERVNWRGRARFSLEQLLDQPDVASAIRIVRQSRGQAKQ